MIFRKMDSIGDHLKYEDNYVNASGNWFMNITPGAGKITFTNFTMQNGWVKGLPRLAMRQQMHVRLADEIGAVVVLALPPQDCPVPPPTHAAQSGQPTWE